jgi:hypothetical protein
MSGVTIDIRDTATPYLEAIKTEAQRGGLILIMGRAGANVVRDHLIALNAARHRYGRGYYRQAAHGTSVQAVPGGAKISINQIGIRQRYFGGTIRPRVAKFLTIPACPEAYGMRAREFNDLDMRLVMNPKTGHPQWALVRRASTGLRFHRRKQKDGSIKMTVSAGEAVEGKVYFWLARKVTQQPDSTVLPKSALIIEAANTAAVRRLFRLKTRAAAQETN